MQKNKIIFGCGKFRTLCKKLIICNNEPQTISDDFVGCPHVLVVVCSMHLCGYEVLIAAAGVLAISYQFNDVGK